MSINKFSFLINPIKYFKGIKEKKKRRTYRYEDCKENHLRWGIHYAFVAHIHDEIQALVKPQHVSLYKKLAVDCFRKSGEYFNLKCPMTGEAREGKNWMETH